MKLKDKNLPAQENLALQEKQAKKDAKREQKILRCQMAHDRAQAKHFSKINKEKIRQEKKNLLQAQRAAFKKSVREERAKLKATKGLSQRDYTIREIAKEQNIKQLRWHKLDNAGLIYPAISYRNNALFRLSVLLNEEVDPLLLQRAVNMVVPRFPTITSSLKAGIFWYYLDSPTVPIIVEEETGMPCKTLKIDHRRSMIRVLFKKHEVAIEYFHTATDGTGGTAFLNCLLRTYFELKGYEIKDTTNAPHPLDKPRYEETVDSFQSVRTKEKGRATHIKSAHMTGEKLPRHAVIYRKAICDVTSLKAVASSFNCTITQYLSARTLDSLAYQMKTTLNKEYGKLPIRLSVPCNLRSFFPSKTYRNFSSYFHVQYEEGDFLSLVEKVKKDFSEQVNKDYFQAMINYNTNAQQHLLMRLVPLPLKNIALQEVYRMFGKNLNSASLSNLGIVKCPKEFEKYIVRYEFAFGEAFCEPTGISISTYNDIMTITCCSIIRDSLFERHLFEEMAKDGVIFCVESTYGGEL